jgi:hypothetical protein
MKMLNPMEAVDRVAVLHIELRTFGTEEQADRTAQSVIKELKGRGFQISLLDVDHPEALDS